jgi:hypothetical protein
MFKPKLCCIVNPNVQCYCGYSLCEKHEEHIVYHISPRPNTPYYFYCHKDFGVIWRDVNTIPTQYKLAFYEDQETKEDTCTEVLGSIKPRNKGRRRQKEVSKGKRKGRLA